jgi:hypothetical protein
LTKARKGPGGRPPAGPDGEEVRNYRHQFATRTPGDLFHLIRSIKNTTSESYRTILTDAIQLYLEKRVTKDHRSLIEQTSEAAQQHCADCREERSSSNRR